MSHVSATVIVFLELDDRTSESLRVIPAHLQNKLLDDPTQQLMDAGITEDTELRLEVAGEAGGFAGPPITLKVRIDLKEFVVETRKVNTSTLEYPKLHGDKRTS